MRDSILVETHDNALQTFKCKPFLTSSLLAEQELTREWNEFKVTERRLSINEVIKASKEGRVIK